MSDPNLMGMDLASLGVAVQVLERNIGEGSSLHAVNSMQEMLFAWILEHREELEALTGIQVRISADDVVLNNFMERRHFGRPFTPIIRGWGVAAIIDRVARWAAPGGLVEIPSNRGVIPGFAISPAGSMVYKSEEVILAQLLTTKGLSYWVAKHPGRPNNELSLYLWANALMRKPRVEQFYQGVQIPFVTAKLKPDLSWLLDAHYAGWKITQAFQMLQVILNETEASTRVGTGVAAEKSIQLPYFFNTPFAVWFTEIGSMIPQGVVWVGEGAMGIRSEADVPFVS